MWNDNARPWRSIWCWRNDEPYKLHKARIKDNLLSLFSSFLSSRCYKELLNTHISHWFLTCTVVRQGSILGPLIFLVYTNHWSNEKNLQWWLKNLLNHLRNPNTLMMLNIKSIFKALLDMQLTIINLQM